MRIKADSLDITNSTWADTTLSLHVHDQSHSRNVAKCKDEIGIE